MAQHDYVIANGSGSAVRGDLNNALAAIVSNNSGASEPSPTYAYQWWADATTGLLKIRNAANNAWITLRELDGTLSIEAGTVSAPGLYFTGDTNTGIYSPAADQFAITTNGVVRLTASTSAVTSSLPVDVPLGTVSAPSLTFTGDLNTGFYSPGADQVAVATNGVQRVNFNAATEVVFNDGGADVDFRIEGDTKANLLLVDASADTVSIDGTAQLANQTPLRFGDSDNSHYVALRAAGTVAANVTWDLPAADGTANQVLKTDGSGGLGWATPLALGSIITAGTAVASTSGTSIDFTGIPSWAKRITVMFGGVSTNGTSSIRLRLGTSSGIATSGYSAASSSITTGAGTTSSTDGFDLADPGSAASVRHGLLSVCLLGSNTWTVNWGIGYSDSARTSTLFGSVTLSGTLDSIRITTVNGTDTFDNGTINILYEG